MSDRAAASRLWHTLGARVAGDGVDFAVWAPHARAVRLVGDFTGWRARDGRPMRPPVGGSSGDHGSGDHGSGGDGIWRLRVPGAVPGQRYRFRVQGVDGVWREKADPMARRTEPPPSTASVIAADTAFEWTDLGWLARRSTADPGAEPMSVYEVHLGSWRPGLSYAKLADELTDYATRMGFTHVELMPVMEHPYGGSWGYQVTGYYAPTARFGSPDDLRRLVDRLHAAGIGVILDWVPAHFPRDEWALAQFDGTPLYEHADPMRGEHPDWGTLVFDYGRSEVCRFLVDNALYWCDEFHADGLRVDAVASMLYLDYSREPGEWEPNAYGGRENLDAITFVREVIAVVGREHPGVLVIAEESTAWPGVTHPAADGGLGFDLKWNMGWMHDTLGYLRRDPIFRQHHHHELTFSLDYAWSERFLLPLSHDEVVHGKGSLAGKMPGDDWQRLATLRALYAFMWAHPGKKLLFMGGELADGREWSEVRGLDWALADDPAHAGVRALVGDLNAAYRATAALWRWDFHPEGFRWLVADDAGGNTLAFARYGGESPPLVCVVNFAGVPHESYRLGLPAAGPWHEMINTDAAEYGGSGVGNLGRVVGLAEPYDGMPASVTLRVPPLGTLWLAPVGTTDPTAAGQRVARSER